MPYTYTLLYTVRGGDRLLQAVEHEKLFEYTTLDEQTNSTAPDRTGLTPCIAL